MSQSNIRGQLGRTIKRVLALAGLAAALSACGGGDHQLLFFTFQGTVSGTNCFSFFEQSMPVRFAVTIVDLSAGSGVTLVDESGITWVGDMTSSSSFRVVDPSGDPRTSIVASDVSSAGAHVVATTTCVSFRCCTALEGDLRT